MWYHQKYTDSNYRCDLMMSAHTTSKARTGGKSAGARVDETWPSDAALEQLEQLARGERTGPDVLDRLVTSALNDRAYGSVLWCVAANPSTAASTLRRLIDVGDGVLLCAIATNPNVTGEVLLRLSMYPIAQPAVAHVTKDADLLHRLAASDGHHVRKRVARNAYTSMDDLATLARDASESVRFSVAANDHSSPATLALLATDPSERVRKAVFLNVSYTTRPCAMAPGAGEAVRCEGRRNV